MVGLSNGAPPPKFIQEAPYPPDAVVLKDAPVLDLEEFPPDSLSCLFSVSRSDIFFLRAAGSLISLFKNDPTTPPPLPPLLPPYAPELLTGPDPDPNA